MKPARASIFLLIWLFVGCRWDASGETFHVGITHIGSERKLEDARALQVNAIRNDLLWRNVERERGQMEIPASYDNIESEAALIDIETLAVLAYGNSLYQEGYPIGAVAVSAFARYAAFSADALGGGPLLLEIWNEWNLGVGVSKGRLPGKPRDYVQLQAAAYKAIKDAAPRAVVLGGSMAGIGRKDGWTRKALDAGMLQYLDGLSFHPYVYWMNRRNRVPERGMLGLVNELEQLLAQYPKGSEVPLYVTEIGWPTHDAREGVTLRQQADYLSRALLVLRADPRIRGVWVHTLMDRPGEAGDMESHFGLLFPDGSPKPAWFSFRDTARLLKPIVECRRIDFGVDSDDLAGVELVDAAGKHHLAIWTIDEDSPWIVELACRVTPVRKVLRRSVIGSGAGPPVALSREPDGESHGSITVGPTPTVIRDVGRHWRIVKAASRYGERESAED